MELQSAKKIFLEFAQPGFNKMAKQRPSCDYLIEIAY